VSGLGASRATLLIGGALAISIAVVISAFALLRTSPEKVVAWATLGSEDVHSLAFVDDDPQRVLFGHHGGLSESSDGGRTWSALPIRDDAMSMAVAGDTSIVIAGHDVLQASRDGGRSWQAIAADLPSLDIHGFTRDPIDPDRMWAYLATGGLWESSDFGAHWTRVREDNVLFPTAVSRGSSTRLFGVDANGLSPSDDGGRTWTSIGTPPTYPMTSFASSTDGTTLYAGSTDGLFRSSDGGATWEKTGYDGSAFAIATTLDGQTVAVVSRGTQFFRSSDGGKTWMTPSLRGAWAVSEAA
jgi:photosystem II stability/assembly factor-like uncharacterized protein